MNAKIKRMGRMFLGVGIFASCILSVLGLPAGSESPANKSAGIGNVNLFNGTLQMGLPLLSIGGRGETQIPINLRLIEEKWRKSYYYYVEPSTSVGYSFSVACSSIQRYSQAPILNCQGAPTNPEPVQKTIWATFEAEIALGFKPGMLVARTQVPEMTECYYCAPGQNCQLQGQKRKATRMTLTFYAPDGSSHELIDAATRGRYRMANDQSSCDVNAPGDETFSRGSLFLSSDGSALTFVSDAEFASPDPVTTDESGGSNPLGVSGVLTYPNGSRFRIDNGNITSVHDRNGNITTLEYFLSGDHLGKLKKVVDSLGRAVTFEYGVSDVAPYGLSDRILYSGINGSPQIIRVSKSSMGNVLRSGDTLKTGSQLFPATCYGWGENACPAATITNPTVTSAVWFPDGTSYKFEYTSFGEVSRVVMPSGGAVEFDHDFASPAVQNFENYALARVVEQKRVYSESNDPESLVSKEEYSRSSGSTVDLTDSSGNLISRTVTHFHGDPSIGNIEGSGAYELPEWSDGHPYKVDSFDSDGTLVRRDLTGWEKPTLNWWTGGSTVRAPDDARVGKTISLIFENSKALATLSTSSYDDNGIADEKYFPFLNVKAQKTYHYKAVNPGTAQSSSIDQIASLFGTGELATTGETDYSYDSGYKARGILSLVTESRALNPADQNDILSKSQTVYDNSLPAGVPGYPYSLHTYGTGNSMDCTSSGQICWANPNGPSGALNLSYRGLPTTARSWVKETSSWIEVQMQYDQFGNPVKTKDPIGNETTTEFNSLHEYAYPTKVITPAPDPNNTGHGTNMTSSIETTYDLATGLPLTVKDDFLQIMRTEYDSSMRPWRFFADGFTAPESQTVYGTPNTSGQLSADQRFVKVRKQIDANYWDEATTWFDGLGRTVKTKAKDSQGDVSVETRYDTSGRPYLVTNPYRAGETTYWTKTRYDSAGRTVETYAPATDAEIEIAENPNLNNANLTSLGVISFDISTSTGYIGTVVTTSDASLREGRSITNALGQLLRVDEPDKTTGALDFGGAPVQSTSYKYDHFGKMVEVTQGGQKRWFKHDSLGRLLRVRHPEQDINQALDMSDPFNTDGDWTAGFAYDLRGNVVRATDANGVNIISEYDNANRVKKRCYTKANISTAATTCGGIGPTSLSTDTSTVEFFYDGKGLAQQQTPHNFAKGKLTKVTSSVSETQYQLFNNFGRLTQSSQITDGQIYTSGYQYNLSGALVQETYPSGRVVKNEFEFDGDLMQVLSRKANDTFRNYVTSFSYTASGGISQMRLGNGKWETAKFNERLQVYELGLGSSASSAALWKVNYAYGELQSNGTEVDSTKNTGNIAKQTLTIPGATFVQNYRYDSLYRLKDAVEPGSGSTPNWTQTFDYDRYGNRTAFTQTVGGVTTHNTTPAVGTAKNRFTSTDFDYDNNGNLIRDKDPITNLTRQFAFNADNKQKEVISNGVSVGSYFYDGEGKRVKKVVGGETTVFVYSAGKLVAEYSTTPPPETGQINYTTTDHLGSPRIITNGIGQVQSRRDFMPFGEDMQPTVGNRSANVEYTAGDQVRQKFTGYQKDDETKLDFAEARMYENRYGRFTAVDPLLASGKSANPQSFNRYIYVGNNPLLLVDRNGLIWGKSEDGRVRWFGKKLGTGFSEFRPDNWEYVGKDNKITRLDPNSREWTQRDVPLRPGPVENSLPMLGASVTQNVKSEIIGILKGIHNSPSVLLNGITGDATQNSFLGRYIFGGSNPFEVPLVFSYNDAREASAGSASSTGTLAGAALAGGTIFGASRVASVVPETTTNSTVTVGRWMTPREYTAMRETGKVQPGAGDTTYVAFPANPNAWIGPARPGTVYVEFGVPRFSLRTAGRPDWAQIPGPNSLLGRNELRFGRPAPQMPTATNPCVIMCRTSVP